MTTEPEETYDEGLRRLAGYLGQTPLRPAIVIVLRARVKYWELRGAGSRSIWGKLTSSRILKNWCCSSRCSRWAWPGEGGDDRSAGTYRDRRTLVAVRNRLQHRARALGWVQRAR